jgi:hypothetical protein
MRQCGTHRLRHLVAFGVVTGGTKNTRQVGFGKLCGIRAASKDSGWCQLRQLRQLAWRLLRALLISSTRGQLSAELKPSAAEGQARVVWFEV